MRAKTVTTPDKYEYRWRIKLDNGEADTVNLDYLVLLAKCRDIKKETLILDVKTNISYSAENIPGIFSNRSNTKALCLSVLCGFLGADRFYLNHYKIGLGKLLSLGGLGVWWFIDVILLASRTVEDSRGLPLR
jgi:hypothetical protein